VTNVGRFLAVIRFGADLAAVARGCATAREKVSRVAIGAGLLLGSHIASLVRQPAVGRFGATVAFVVARLFVENKPIQIVARVAAFAGLLFGGAVASGFRLPAVGRFFACVADVVRQIVVRLAAFAGLFGPIHVAGAFGT